MNLLRGDYVVEVLTEHTVSITTHMLHIYTIPPG